MFSPFSIPGLIALLLTLLGGLLLWLGRRQRQRSGLPEGTVLYRDTGEWQETERPLRSRRYGLVGRPDYLVQTRDRRQELRRPGGGQESRPPGPALRQPHPATGDILSAGRGKLRSCAPLRPAALRRRHATHRRTQTNCAAACWIRPPRSGRRGGPRTCAAATVNHGAARAAVIAPRAGRRRLTDSF